MKKSLIPIFSLLVLLNGCQKEKNLNQDDLNKFSKEDARVFLRENVGLKTNNLTVHTKLNLTLTDSAATHSNETGTLLWSRAKEYNYNNVNVVEVPYAKKRKTVFLYNFVGNADPDSPQELRAEHSYTNLLLYKKADGSVEKFFLTYIPDESSVGLDNTGKVSEMNEHFNGFVEYRDWEQTPLFLVRVKNGLLYRKFALSTNGNNLMKSGNNASTASASNCTTVCTPIYQVTCAGPIEGIGGGQEVCTVTQTGQNCVQVCSEAPSPNDPPFPPNPGSGGTPSNDNPNIQASFTEIFDVPNFCQNASAQASALATAFSELTSTVWYNRYTRCMTMKIINAMRSSNPANRIKICMDPNVIQASYRAAQNTIYFKDAFNINADNLLHELFHVFQNKKYPNGISYYQDSIANPQLTGYSDIEFERAFFQDLMNATTGHQTLWASKTDQYENFLKGLTQGGNLNNAKMYFNNVSFLAYYNYLIEFKQEHSSYNKPHALLTPAALVFLFEDFNCINLPGN